MLQGKWTKALAILASTFVVFLSVVLLVGAHFDWQSHDGKTRINVQIGASDPAALSTVSVIFLVLGIGFLSVLGRTSNPAGFFRRLTTSNQDCWIGGVCGGLGAHTSLPSWLWRLLFAVLLFAYGTGLLAYIVLWIFIPAAAPEQTKAPGSPAMSA